MKTGIIDVGGGNRGAYTAGVYDWCIDNDIHFDYCMGISAGSANLSSYIAGQRGRNMKFYDDINLRSESMSMRNLIKNGDYVDLEYIYGEMSNSYGECPLDYDAMMANPAEFTVVATNALTGKPVYFGKKDIRRDELAPIKASSCVPAANRPYMINGIPFYDGGISDPIPLEKCFEDGCDKVVVLLTRPRDYVRNPDKDRLVSNIIKRKYPEASKAMAGRAEKYNTQVWLAKQYEKDGRVMILAPDDIGGMHTLTKDQEMIEALYQKGYHDAEAIADFIK